MNDTERETVTAWSERRGFMLTLTRVDLRPDGDLGWTEQRGSRHFKFLIRVEQRHGSTSAGIMTGYYSQGAAHTSDPTLPDIISALLLDISCIDSRSFEDFCSDMGLDTDSRKAERTYQACKKTERDLIRLIGRAELSYALYEVENDL